MVTDNYSTENVELKHVIGEKIVSDLSNEG